MCTLQVGAECSCLLEVDGRHSSHQEGVGSEEEYKLCMYSTEQALSTHVLVLLPGHVNDTDPLAVAETVTREAIEVIYTNEKLPASPLSMAVL